MITATATEIQNHFGRYLSLVMSVEEVLITKNGREACRFVPKDASVSYLTDSLTGILKESRDPDAARSEGLCEKYHMTSEN